MKQASPAATPPRADGAAGEDGSVLQDEVSWLVHDLQKLCIIRKCRTAILGSGGYTGQETLDRVLAHPELELVALGSDSLAGRPRPRWTSA